MKKPSYELWRLLLIVSCIVTGAASVSPGWIAWLISLAITTVVLFVYDLMIDRLMAWNDNLTHTRVRTDMMHELQIKRAELKTAHELEVKQEVDRRVKMAFDALKKKGKKV